MYLCMNFQGDFCIHRRLKKKISQLLHTTQSTICQWLGIEGSGRGRGLLLLLPMQLVTDILLGQSMLEIGRRVLEVRNREICLFLSISFVLLHCL